MPIRNAEAETEILIFGDIGESFWDLDGGITAKGVKAQLDAAGKDDTIVVRINSPGGDAFEGVAIFNLLSSDSRKVIVKVDGTAISAASIIAMAGDEIRMASNALMMIHDAWTMAAGDANGMRETADRLDKVSNALAQTYADRTGKTVADSRTLMLAETWMSAEEALDDGFATHVDSAAMSVAAMLTDRYLDRYDNAPATAAAWRAGTTDADAFIVATDSTINFVGNDGITVTWTDANIAAHSAAKNQPPASSGGDTPNTKDRNVDLKETQAALTKASEELGAMRPVAAKVEALEVSNKALEAQNVKLAKERDEAVAELTGISNKNVAAEVEALVGKKFHANEYDEQLELAKKDRPLFDRMTAQRKDLTILVTDPAAMGADPTPRPSIGTDANGQGMADLINAANG